MMSPFLGEFLGTMFLILLGNGVVANVLLKDSKAEGAGWMVIATGWGFGVMVGVFVAIAFGSPDAHINPAVTLAYAVIQDDFGKLPVYLPAQFLGAFAGAVLVWLHFLPHWARTENAEAKRACFCTSPAIRSAGSNLASEMIGTVVLIVGVGAISSHAVSGSGPAPALGPYLVGGLVWGIGLSLGGTTGYAINPARDLAPRLAHALLPISGKGSSDWGYAWIPVVGPVLGAIVAAVLLKIIS
jgi:glycerol uptake facilitator protein